MKLLKAGLWYVIGNLLIKGIAFISTPLFTRLLSIDEFGTYSTYTAYESLLSVIIGGGIFASIKNAKFDYSESFDDYVASALFITIIPFILVLMVGNLFIDVISPLIGLDQILLNVLIIQSYATAIITFNSVKYSINLQYKKFMLISLITSLASVSLSILFIFTIFNDDRLVARILGGAIPTIIIAVCLAFIIFRKRKLFNLDVWKYSIPIGLPLVPHSLSQIILSVFDRVMINSIIGSTAAGIYSFTSNVGNLLFIIWNSLDQVWAPTFYQLMHDKNYNEIQGKSKIYVIIFSYFTIGMVTISPEVIMILAPKEYWVGRELVIPICISVYFTFLYSFPVNVEYFFKKTKYISLGTLCAAILNVVLNFAFIPKFGFVAAAYTTLISYIALFIFHWLIAKRIFSKRLFNGVYMLNATIIVIVISFIQTLLFDQWVIRYLFLMLISASVLIYLILIRKIVINKTNKSNI